MTRLRSRLRYPILPGTSTATVQVPPRRKLSDALPGEVQTFSDLPYSLPPTNSETRPPGMASCVYRIYDRNHVLLYVGMSVNPRGRFRAHSMDKDWWKDTHHCSLTWYPDLRTTELAEHIGIYEGAPIHNLRGRTLPYGYGRPFADAAPADVYPLPEDPQPQVEDEAACSHRDVKPSFRPDYGVCQNMRCLQMVRIP